MDGVTECFEIMNSKTFQSIFIDVSSNSIKDFYKRLYKNKDIAFSYEYNNTHFLTIVLITVTTLISHFIIFLYNIQ